MWYPHITVYTTEGGEDIRPMVSNILTGYLLDSMFSQIDLYKPVQTILALLTTGSL